MSRRNIEKIIANVKIDDRYCITTSELNQFREKNMLDAIVDAFYYGYALGQRAEKKRLNRTANTVKPIM